MELIKNYIDALNRQFRTGIAREHAYRGFLQTLVEELASEVVVTNDPARIHCGAPDYILTRNGIPIAYIEAKDIGKDLSAKEYKEQFDRYKGSLNNLLITNYLDFWLFRDGELVNQVRLAEIRENTVLPVQEGIEDFVNLITEFTAYVGQTITSAPKLSKMMADKARLLAAVIEKALNSDVDSEENSTLREQMKAFEEILIHDITTREFADIYAQTIAYGMFAARIHDKTLDDFSRHEAAELIPKSNPFLRNLFGYIAGPNLDDRIKWIVDALADIFRATDVTKLLASFGKATQRTDPVIHFYETFLSEYDPALRRSRGVWYTPEPVVSFVVRSVDYLLKTSFDLSSGLADTSKTTVREKSQVPDRRTKTGFRMREREVHKVQILDPAAGTGTFLAEIVKQVYESLANQRGMWSKYVENHLIPRLNGFEVLMASYAMAHLKLEMLLGDTGFQPKTQQRLRVFLTNSLEEHHPDTGTLFASWLSKEASEANHIKRDAPVMVVLGNPPYSGISTNQGAWITELIEDYKYVDGEHFGERKHWLQDDYVKFIRYAQYFIERNGEGIVAYINNHSFLDNPTFRGMRWNLLEAFDELYIVNLHGSSKKANLKPADVDHDQNVFDIQQGVSINVFVKKKRSSNPTAKVKYAEVWGTREEKYAWLWSNNLESLDWEVVECKSPNYFFVPGNYDKEERYNRGVKIDSLFPLSTMGFASAKDALTVAFDSDTLWNTVSFFREHSEQEIRHQFGLKKDSRDWKVSTAKADITANYDKSFIRPVAYRPFDERVTYYTGNSRGFFASPQRKVMHHLGRDENVALCSCRMNRDFSHTYWIVRDIVSKSVISSLDNAYVFPLYLFPEESVVDEALHSSRTPNLNREVITEFEEGTALTYEEECSRGDGVFCPFDVVDYVYAVLNTPSYLEEYKELLKVDFPRVPLPKSAEAFWSFVKVGKQLRELHLPGGGQELATTATYPVDGDNIVRFVRREGERVLINDTQYFDHVHESAWLASVGGYRPAEKWLKDRVGETLDLEDIIHYQKLLARMEETRRLSKELDEVGRRFFERQ